MATVRTADRETVNIPSTAFPDANHLKVEVFYSAGGMNYATYKTDPRGFYASFRPVFIEDDGVFTTERYMAFSTNPAAFSAFLIPATRFNRKALAKLAGTVLPQAAEFSQLLAAGQRESVIARLVIAAQAAK